MLLTSTYVYCTVVSLAYHLWQAHSNTPDVSEVVLQQEPDSEKPSLVTPPVPVIPGSSNVKSKGKPTLPLELSGSMLHAAWAWNDPAKKQQLADADVPVVLNVHGLDLGWRELFELKLGNGQRLRARDCQLATRSKSTDGLGVFDATLIAGETASLRCPSDIEVQWSAALLRIPSGAEALRFRLSFDGVSATGGHAAASVERLTLWDAGADSCPEVDREEWPAGAGCFRVSGEVDGSPLVNAALGAWIAMEHPRAVHASKGGFLEVGLSKPLPRTAYYASLGASRKVNATRDGAEDAFRLLRRHFQAYLNSIRASKHRPNLHYATWYDLRRTPCTDSSPLGYTSCSMAHPLNENKALDRLKTVQRELALRSVSLDGFLLDDGWDDLQSLWRVNPQNFPQGLTKLNEEISTRGSRLGVWMSPWGGFLAAGEKRLKLAISQGFEFVNKTVQFLRLDGARYYERFRNAARELAFKSGARFFKFDGFGAGGGSHGAGDFSASVDKLLHLAAELREDTAGSGGDKSRSLWIDVSTGAWPSPFWLISVDSVERDGPDLGKEGAGSARQQWITFRDATLYSRVVRRAPLFPLTSSALGGIVWSRAEEAGAYLNSFEFVDFSSEVRSAFLSGLAYQELKIQPELLTPAHWDILAEVANISRHHVDVLRDTHWHGGDPAKGDAYGYSSYACPPCSGFITWRNPQTTARNVSFVLRQVLSLPRPWPGGGPLTQWRLVELWPGGSQKYNRVVAWKNVSLDLPLQMALQGDRKSVV